METLGERLRLGWPPAEGMRRHLGAALDERLVQELLRERPQRIEHVRGVARTARELAPQLGLTGETARELEMAALFHDVGYAAVARGTGYHPLDGAVLLAHLGAPDPVVAAVLLHGLAGVEGRELPAAAAAYRLPVEHADLIDAVSFCDLRTGPDGEAVTLGERIESVATRYGEEDEVTVVMRAKRSAFEALLNRVLRRVAAHAGSPLPWLFLDIDGTLVPYGATISPGNLAALRRYAAAGGRVTLATGKLAYAMREIVAAAELPGPHIASNGALLVRDGEVEILAELGERAGPAAAFLREHRIPYAYYTPAGIVVDSAETTAEHTRSLTRHDEPEPMVRPLAAADRVLKILTFVRDDEAERDAALRSEAGALGVSCVRTTPLYLEYVPLGHFKDAALRRALAEEGWPSFHTVACGDGENDLPMLRAAGRSFAVGDAPAPLRATADVTLPECGADAVADLVDRLLRAREL